MTAREIKQVLAACRPGEAGSADPAEARALEHLQRDSTLQTWFVRQNDFHAKVRESLRRIPVPVDLEKKILHPPGPVRRIRWPAPVVWAVAAGVVLMITLSVAWLRMAPKDSLPIFRSRMVRTVQREYRMDLASQDMAQIRRFLAVHRAPADYELRDGLAGLQPVGAGLLTFQGQRVAMVCLESASKNPAYLFVVDRTAVRPNPPTAPEFVQVNKFMTASWIQGDKAYLLAAPASAGTLRQYF